MEAFDVEGGRRILVCAYGGKLFAADAACTHEDADLSNGFLGPGGVRCPLHLSEFDLESGAPRNPPAKEPLRTYNVKIDGGEIFAEV